jgi:hypothetical protein
MTRGQLVVVPGCLGGFLDVVALDDLVVPLEIGVSLDFGGNLLVECNLMIVGRCPKDTCGVGWVFDFVVL